MATMKRRVIYLSDEQWEYLKIEAAAEGKTVSAMLRKGVTLVHPRADELAVTRDGVPESTIDSARRTHTGHRDGNPGAASDRFNSRPFRPVPKR